MLLKEYKSKRTFEKTPEPTGRGQASAVRSGQASADQEPQLRFVIQRHKARRLHYDLRLELDGVLKSWAVPKGPSLDPDVKRLAMMVEDHPLDYMTFEGNIPKGNYGAGNVIVWDMGYYHYYQNVSPKQNIERIRYGIDKGHLNFVLYGQKIRGHFSLIRIKAKEKNDFGNTWLLMKHADDEFISKEDPTKDDTSVLEPNRAKMPHDIRPMLATLVPKPFDKENWLFEVKWDGYRAITEIEDGKIKIYSRNGNSFNKKYPTITKALSTIDKDAVLDGEIVALKNSKPDFHSLQGFEDNPVPLQYVVFDLLYYDGRDLRNEPLVERKRILKYILPRNKTILYSEHLETHGKAFFESIKKEGFEGMIAKECSSKYIEGTRSKNWLKIKNFNQKEAVIIGYTKPRASRKFLGSLVLGSYDSGDLKYIGHSGGGFTDKELKDLYEKLSKIKSTESSINEKVPINSPITWVKPKYVAELEFSEWTPDGRMRHPIYKGLRNGKNGNGSSEQKFTNLDKVFWPEEGYTKGDVIEYYRKISETILPYLKDRPESLNRHPNGITGSSFFQKNAGELKLPRFIETKKIWSESNKKDIKYLICNNQESLLYLANLGCIELNPWNSRTQSLDRPDYLIIDLDPGNNTFNQLVDVAKVAHEVLQESKEESFIKTSGKTGLHIFVPLGAQYDYNTTRTFAELLVRVIHARIPDITSLERSPAKRKNKIYLDWLQNRKGQTIAAPYSLRPYPGATVSTPLDWKEIKHGLDPSKFTIKTIFKRLEKIGDIWEPLLKHKIDMQESLKYLDQKNLME